MTLIIPKACTAPLQPDWRGHGIQSMSPQTGELLTFVGHLTLIVLLSIGTIPLAQWIGTAYIKGETADDLSSWLRVLMVGFGLMVFTYTLLTAVGVIVLKGVWGALTRPQPSSRKPLPPLDPGTPSTLVAQTSG